MKNIIKMVTVLSLLCAIAGFGLAYLKQSTALPIENQLLTYVQGPAILSVFDKIDNSPIKDRKKFKLESGQEVNVFPAFKDGKLVGVAIESFGQGFGGDIGVMAGFDLSSDKLFAIGITTMRETPGLGTVIANKPFTKLFINQALPVALKSDGGQIDAISGATVSSRGAVLATTNAGIIYKSLKSQILQTWKGGDKNEFLQGIHQRPVE